MADWQFWTLLGFLFVCLWWFADQLNGKLDRIIELLEAVRENQGTDDD
jgi:hypothetical protein